MGPPSCKSPRPRPPRETDFHSLRRTFVTLLENAGVDQVRIARYVGHEVPTMAGAIYSAGLGEAAMLEIARVVRYSPDVEDAVLAFGAGGGA